MVSKSILLLRVYRKLLTSVSWSIMFLQRSSSLLVWNNFQKFMDDVLRLRDVYFVTSYQVIEWMRKPTSLNAIETLKAWQCNLRKFHSFELACDLPASCKLPSKVLKSYRYLHTCFDCPKEYPWLRNEFGAEWCMHWEICVDVARRNENIIIIKLFIYYKKTCVFIFLYEKSCLFVLYISLYSLYTM